MSNFVVPQIPANNTQELLRQIDTLIDSWEQRLNADQQYFQYLKSLKRWVEGKRDELEPYNLHSS